MAPKNTLGAQSKYLPLVALIVAVTALGPVALNMMIPSMPSIAREFGIDYGIVQFTLTLYLLTVAFGQLIYGPLSDHFGRKPVLVAGIAVYIIGSVLGMLAPNITILVGARIIQAFGGCAGLVIGRAMVRDLFDRSKSASVLGYIASVMVIAPMLSPAIGGFIEEHSGWRNGFLLLALVAAPVLIWTLIGARETRPPTAPAKLLAGMSVLMREPAFLWQCVVLGATTAIFFVFLAGAPLTVMEGMGLGPFEYGMWFMTNAFAYLTGNFFSGRYSTQLGPERMVRLGTSIAFVASLVLIATMVFLPHHPLSLFGPIFFIAASQGLTLPNSAAQALSVRPDYAGAAAGLSGFAQVGFGAIAALIIGKGFTADGMVMTYAMMAFAIVGFLAQFQGHDAAQPAAR